MKHPKLLIAIFSLSFLSFSSMENYSKLFTTVCQETFHFFFLSKGECPTFWIGIDVRGECYSSHLVQISIKDSSVSVLSSELEEYNNWKNIPELNSVLNTYEENKIESKGDGWFSKGIKITPPKYDSKLAEEFDTHVIKGGSNAYTWYKENVNCGLLLPKIEGLNTELLYQHNRGLYFNYNISEAHYFPNNYLVIFTHQPKLAVGDDSMHGYFIFKIKKGA